jgi:hypothetical protein
MRLLDYYAWQEGKALRWADDVLELEESLEDSLEEP